MITEHFQSFKERTYVSSLHLRKSTFCNAAFFFAKVQMCDSWVKMMVVDIKGGMILNLQVWHFGFSFSLSTYY